MLVEQRVRGRGDRGQLHDAGVVDQHVDAAVVVLGGVEHRLDRGRIGDVRLHRARHPAGLRDLFGERLSDVRTARVIDHDREAVFGEALGHRRADAA